MQENAALFELELSGEEIAAIDALDKGEVAAADPNPDVYEGF